MKIYPLVRQICAVMTFAAGFTVCYADSNVSSLMVDGDTKQQTLKVIFNSYVIPYSIQGNPKNRTYYVMAQIPSGEKFYFSKEGWVYSSDKMVATGQVAGSSIYSDPDPLTIVDNLDITSLVGTNVYAGVVSNGVYTSNLIGTVLPDRNLKTVAFPFSSGSWAVSRAADASGKIFCSITSYAKTFDSLFYVNFGWYKSGKNESINTMSYLDGVSSASTMVDAHQGNTTMKVDNNTAFALNNAGGAYWYDSKLFKSYGPQSLAYNFQPNVSQMMSGRNLAVNFASKAGVINYSVIIDLNGFASAVNAFDYCVSTQ